MCFEEPKHRRLYLYSVVYDEDVDREALLEMALRLACDDIDGGDSDYYLGRAYERVCAQRTYEDREGNKWSQAGER